MHTCAGKVVEIWDPDLSLLPISKNTREKRFCKPDPSETVFFKSFFIHTRQNFFSKSETVELKGVEFLINTLRPDYSTSHVWRESWPSRGHFTAPFPFFVFFFSIAVFIDKRAGCRVCRPFLFSRWFLWGETFGGVPPLPVGYWSCRVNDSAPASSPPPSLFLLVFGGVFFGLEIEYQTNFFSRCLEVRLVFYFFCWDVIHLVKRAPRHPNL